MAQSEIAAWSNPLPGAVGLDLEIIFNSLTQWLQNPTFINGIQVGSGVGPTYDSGSGAQTNPAPLTNISGPVVSLAPPGSTGAITAIESNNFVTLTSGWAIDGNGNAEFNSVNIYGGILQIGTRASGKCQITISSTSGVGDINFFTNQNVADIQASNNGTYDGLNLTANAVSQPAQIFLDMGGGVKIKAGATLNLSTVIPANITMLAEGNITIQGINSSATPVGLQANVMGQVTPALLASQIPIVQTGHPLVTFAGGTGTLTFPTAFPNGCDGCLVVPGASLGTDIINVGALTATTAALSGVTATNTALAGNFTCNYIAIGH